MRALTVGLARHRLCVSVLVALALLDIATTTLGLTSAPGFVREHNSLGVAAWSLAGPLGLLASKFIFSIPLAATLVMDGRDPDDCDLHRLVGVTLLGGALFSSLIVAGNLAILAGISRLWPRGEVTAGHDHVAPRQHVLGFPSVDGGSRPRAGPDHGRSRPGVRRRGDRRRSHVLHPGAAPRHEATDPGAQPPTSSDHVERSDPVLGLPSALRPARFAPPDDDA